MYWKFQKNGTKQRLERKRTYINEHSWLGLPKNHFWKLFLTEMIVLFCNMFEIPELLITNERPRGNSPPLPISLHMHYIPICLHFTPHPVTTFWCICIMKSYALSFSLRLFFVKAGILWIHPRCPDLMKWSKLCVFFIHLKTQLSKCYTNLLNGCPDVFDVF